MEQIKCDAKQMVSISLEEYKALIWELAQQEQRLEIFRLKEQLEGVKEQLEEKKTEATHNWCVARNLEDELANLKRSMIGNEAPKEEDDF